MLGANTKLDARCGAKGKCAGRIEYAHEKAPEQNDWQEISGQVAH
jgi:hypothetical protein